MEFGKGITLYTGGGHIITSMTHINKDLERIQLHEGEKIELDGELYLHGKPYSEISGMARRHEFQTEHEQIEYHVVDIINDDKQSDRVMQLKAMFAKAKFEHVKKVKTLSCKTNLVSHWLSVFMADGYEGIILRHPKGIYERKRSQSILKIKPTKTDTYRIVGTEEEMSVSNVPKDTLGSLICEKDGDRFRVGTGRILTKIGRKRLWDMRLNLDRKYFVVIKYLNLTAGRQVPYQPVALDIIDRENKRLEIV